MVVVVVAMKGKVKWYNGLGEGKGRKGEIVKMVLVSLMVVMVLMMVKGRVGQVKLLRRESGGRNRVW